MVINARVTILIKPFILLCNIEEQENKNYFICCAIVIPKLSDKNFSQKRKNKKEDTPFDSKW